VNATLVDVDICSGGCINLYIIEVWCNDQPCEGWYRRKNPKLSLYMGPCLGVSAYGSWRVRKRPTVIIVNKEVLILIPATTYRSETF
jgi:hypothetical protein